MRHDSPPSVSLVLPGGAVVNPRLGNNKLTLLQALKKVQLVTTCLSTLLWKCSCKVQHFSAHDHNDGNKEFHQQSYRNQNVSEKSTPPQKWPCIFVCGHFPDDVIEFII